MARVIEELRRDHDNMTRLLEVLEGQVAAFSGGASDYDLIQSVVDYCLTYPELCHHPKEDAVYKRLAARDPAAAAEVGDILAEHAELGELTRRFAATLHNVVQEANVPRELFETLAREFIAFYRHHIAREEDELFPRALKALNEADWTALEAAAPVPDLLFGERVEDRYLALYERIMRYGR